MDINTVIIILISLVCSAFFSGMEIAFITANKLQVELQNKQGKISARIISGFMKRPSRFIGTMLVGNNIALVIYGIFMGAAILWLFNAETWNDSIKLLVQTVVSTLIILVTAEFLPKTIFRINPNRALNVLAIPLAVLYGILYLPMIFTIGIAELILRAFGIKSNGERVGFARIDLENYVNEMTDRAANKEEELDHEIQIFKNALDFSNVKARDCMVPRTELVALELDEDIEKLNNTFIETGLSKILIYRDTIDNVIGYTHSYEMFQKPENIAAMLRPISIVPEAISAHELLNQLVEQRRTLAVVVDEFGGTSGLVTIEDVIEEIFGEIEDEHDREELIDEQLGDHVFRFAARLEVDLLNEKYELGIPKSEEYETVGGFIIAHAESIPEQGKEFKIGDFKLVIEQVSDSRIETVQLTRLNA